MLRAGMCRLEMSVQFVLLIVKAPPVYQIKWQVHRIHRIHSYDLSFARIQREAKEDALANRGNSQVYISAHGKGHGADPKI